MKIGRIMHVHSSALLRDAKEQNRLMMMSSVTIFIVGSKEGKFIPTCTVHSGGKITSITITI